MGLARVADLRRGQYLSNAPHFLLPAIGVGLLAGGLAVLASPPVALAGVTGLLALGLMLSSPQISLLAVVGVVTLLPFAVLPVRFGLTLSLLEGALLVLFAVWLLRLISRAGERFESSPLNVLVVAFLGLSVFSFVLGINHNYDSSTVHNYFKMTLAIVLFFAVLSTVRRREQVERLIAGLILAGSVSALLGLALYAIDHSLAVRILSALSVVGYPSGPGVLRFVEDNPALPLRAISTSVDPNSFGGMLVVILGLAVSQFFAKAPLVNRWFLLPSILALSICILLTNSRAAWLGAGVALAFVATFEDRRLWLLMIGGIVLAAVLGLGGGFLDRLQAGLMLQDRATQMRLAEYQNAFEIIRHYPWFGVGFGTAPEIDLTTGVSSIYLTIAERMGLAGLASFLAVVTVFFLRGFGALHRLADQRSKAVLIGIMASVSGALTVGVLDHYYFNIEFPHMVALFWLLIGLGMITMRLGAPGEAQAAELTKE